MNAACPTTMTRTDNINAVFFNQHPVSRQCPIGAKDTLKTVQSSDLGPNFSCWEAGPILASSDNTNKLQEIQTA